MSVEIRGQKWAKKRQTMCLYAILDLRLIFDIVPGKSLFTNLRNYERERAKERAREREREREREIERTRTKKSIL